MNLNSLEQIAREKLGMQKATTAQTKYVALPKKDHVEAAVEEIQMEKDKTFLQKIIEYITNIF